MAKGTITHIEFPADDIERAKRFYGAVAGWEFNEMPGMDGYWLFRTAAEAGGGVGRRGETVGDAVRVYIDVDDLEGAVEAATANGGTVITPPSDIPGQGRFAAVRDPEGNEVGLYEADPELTRLVDSHCHLNADRFETDVDQVVGGARLAGLERILVPGWNVASSERALACVERFAWLDAAVGVHPHDAAKVDDAGWGRIVGWARDPRVAAIGETGLDYDRLFSPVPDQLGNLRRNLALALETGKPAILHCRSAAGLRDAQDALVEELRAAGVGGPAWAAAFGERPPAVIHSFSGPLDYARTVIALGLAVSFSGLVFRAGEEPSADAAAIVPADRLLIETDSPFLAPPGAPRSRNEPEWVRVTGAWLAERRAMTPDALGDDLVAAYDRTFPSERRSA